MKRISPIVTALFLLAACGGDSTGEDSATPPTGTDTSTTVATTLETTTAADNGPEAPEAEATTTSFAAMSGGLITVSPGEQYGEYTTITEPGGGIEVSTPVDWSDSTWGIWEEEGIVGTYVLASPDSERWYDTWGMEGAYVGVNSLPGPPEDYLDLYSYSDDCDHVDRYPYHDETISGSWDLYENCGGEGSVFIVIAAKPPDLEYLLYMEVVVTSDADLVAMDQIISTLQVK